MLIFATKPHYIVIMENTGNTIKERRKALSITQRELAALAGGGNKHADNDRTRGSKSVIESDDEHPEYAWFLYPPKINKA